MTADQSATADMFRTVITTSDAHPTAYTGLTAFTDPLARFKAVVASLDAAILKQGSGGSVASNTSKAEEKEAIIPDIVRYSNALRLAGIAAEDRTAELMNKITPSLLRNADEDEFYGTAQRIMEEIGALDEAIRTPLRVSDAQITATATRLANWKNLRKQGRHLSEESAEATKEIARLLKQGAEILEREMDPAVELLAAEQPAFHSEYFGSREVYDASYNTRAATVSVTAVVDGVAQPLGGVAAVVEPGGLEKVTGPAGKFFIKTLAAGTYSLSLSRPGYLPVSQEFVVVDGEMTTVNVVMTVDSGGSGD